MKIKTIFAVSVLLFASGAYAQPLVKGVAKEALGKDVLKNSSEHVAVPYKVVVAPVNPFGVKNLSVPATLPLEEVNKAVQAAVSAAQRHSPKVNLENSVSAETLEGLSIDALKNLEYFIEKNGRYPNQKFFENGTEVPEYKLNGAKREEVRLFSDLETAMRLLPANEYVQKIVMLKEFYTAQGIRSVPASEPVKILSREELTFNKLRDFIKINHRFPQSHFGEDIEGFSAKEQTALAKESVLREQVEQVIANSPDNIWAKEMASLKKDFAQ